MKATKMEYIEIAKFTLKDGVTDNQIIETEKEVRNSLIKTQKGFISSERSNDRN